MLSPIFALVLDTYRCTKLYRTVFHIAVDCEVFWTILHFTTTASVTSLLPVSLQAPEVNLMSILSYKE